MLNFLRREPGFYKRLFKLSLPMILQNLITFSLGLIDTFMVSRLGNAEMAAVTTANVPVFLLTSIVFGFQSGLGILVSQYWGKGDEKSVSQALGVASLLGTAVTLPLALVFALVPVPVMDLLSNSHDLSLLGAPYLRVIGFAYVFNMLSSIYVSARRSVEDPAFGMKLFGFSTILNTGLNYLLIFGNGGFPALGVAGAAWATIISQFVSFCLLLAGCAKGGNLHIHISRVQLKPPYYVQIVRGGLPSLARQGLASVAAICLNRAAGPYGDAAIAAMGVVQRIMMFGGSAMIGFGQGFQPVCGFNYGARLYHRVKEGFWFCVKSSTLFLTAIAALGAFFAPQLIAVFRDDPEVIEIGTMALRFQCLTLCLSGWIVMSNMMLQTIGKTAGATFVAMSRQGIFFIPLVYILSSALGLTGVEMTQSAADLLTLLCAVPIQLKALRELDSLEGAR